MKTNLSKSANLIQVSILLIFLILGIFFIATNVRPPNSNQAQTIDSETLQASWVHQFDWQFILGNSGESNDTYGSGIVLGQDGNIYVCGQDGYQNWNTQKILFKFDLNGTKVQEDWYNLHTEQDQPGGLAVDSNGSLYLTGANNWAFTDMLFER